MFQVASQLSSGYKLIDKGNGLWQLKMPKGTYTGSWDKVVNYAVLVEEFEMKELLLGRKEMEKKFDDAAEYGIFKSFMWSYDTKENNPKFKNAN